MPTCNHMESSMKPDPDQFPDESGYECPDCGETAVYDTVLDDDSGRVESSCDECDYVETSEAE